MRSIVAHYTIIIMVKFLISTPSECNLLIRWPVVHELTCHDGFRELSEVLLHDVGDDKDTAKVHQGIVGAVPIQGLLKIKK